MKQYNNPIKPMDPEPSAWGCACFVATCVLVGITAFVITCLWARGGWH